jgi:dipeptidyl aminopeptidase/acylaminoacyl peptidase
MKGVMEQRANTGKQPATIMDKRSNRRSQIRSLCAAALALFSLSGQAAPERSLHRFLEIALSPDGSRVASVEGDAPLAGGAPVIRTLVVRICDGGTAMPIALPDGAVPEAWPSSPVWSPDGATLAFALRKPGSHARLIYSVAAKGGPLTQILSFNGTIVDLRYSPGGKLAILATENATKEVGATQAGAPITGDLSGPIPEQRIAILEGGKLHWCSPAGMFVYEYDWLPDGSGFVGTASPGDGDENWWVAKLYRFDGADGTARILFAPPDPRHQIADPVVSPDGNSAAFISGIMSDFGAVGGDVYTVPIEGGGPAVNVTPGMRASARSLAWNRGGRLRAEFLAGSSCQLVEFADVSSAAPPSILWQGEQSLYGRNAGLSLAGLSPLSASVHQSFTAPPEIEVGPIGQWRDLTSCNAGITMPLTGRSLTWKSDQWDVQGWLLLPLSAQDNLAMIMVVHGGPASATIPVFYGPSLYRSLLLKGYALFLPNPRGSFGQGEAFAAANARDFGYGDLRDDLSGIDAVEHAAPIDDRRLGIMGGSYGGYMTMWAVTQTDRFKAGVASAGISDWLSYYGENGIDQWMLPYFGASVYEDSAIYARSSPINFIRNVKTPVFEFVGAQDIECPAPQTQEFWHALHDLGVPTSYAIYPGEGHALRDPAHIADARARTLDWFDRYLK